ncbi:MAG TPA: hypothetical protein VEB19_04795 [Gemmatimonadaceae bacterium]|nr:hypothetical protein [Gemmatimonadaceae bacterium]
MHRLRLLTLVVGAAMTGATTASAQTLDSLTLNALRWRTVGPANFEGRVTDIDGLPGGKTFFVAAAAGGVWKTTNGGVTFRPTFDNYPCASTGAIAIAPSDTQVVWLGTGEPNSRNSIEPGCGIFKSTDGGLTWRSMGLEKTQHIGRIVIHPTNPNIVYVAALGAAWKNNPERGLYKTTDGGQTWQLVKFISDKAGFIDVQMHPTNPNILLAASWERIRGPYFLRSGGPGSALWKSTDGGTTWTELKGSGWPTTMLGRISPRFAPSNPEIIYAMVEADSVRGRPSQPRQPRQSLGNGLYRSTNGGQSWEKMHNSNTRPFYYSQVRVHPRNPDRVWWSSTPVMVSNDGGKTGRTASQGIHVDHHAMWIDPADPEHMILGNDGGIAITNDGGGSYDFAALLPLAQPYEVSYDFAVPYNICGGMQDNGSWCGPSRRKNGPVTNAYWFTFNGGDGFYTAQHPTDPNIIFGESQGGNMARYNVATGQRNQLVKPSWRPRYLQYEDSILVERGDTTRPASREQERRIADFRARQRTDSAELDMRWNWNTPFFLSPHNPNVFYAGANRVMKSTQLGDNLFPISPDLSKKQYAKIDTSMRKTGGITLDATGAETYGTIVALAESYVRPGFLWAGTDDGNVWFTRSDGASWEAIPATRFPGLPGGDVYVTRIEPSHFDSLTAYVAFDNHRWNDFAPYLYITTDGGRTFRAATGDLPRNGIDNLHVVREDPTNQNLLYVGTSRGVYVSLNRGQNWQRFMTGLPTVPVYDLQVHPRDRELIAATHGRGFWIADIAPLQQINSAVLAKNIHLFAPKRAFEYGQGPNMGASANGAGHKEFAAPSPQHGAEIVYRLASAASEAPRIVITNAIGDTIRSLTGPRGAGVHKVTWDLRGTAPRRELSPAQRRDSALAAQRATFVIDSLEKSGKIPAPVIRSMRSMASGQLPPGFGGGGGGGGGGAGQANQQIARLGPGGQWVPRPGEGNAPGGGGGGGGGGGAANAMAQAFGGPEEMQAAFPGGFQEIQALFQVPGRAGVSALGGGGGGGGFGGNQAPIAQTGDYLVTLKVGNEVQRQMLRVEHVGRTGEPVISTNQDDQ